MGEKKISIIVLLWILFAILGSQVYLLVDSYHQGYQLIYLPRALSTFPIGEYIIEYIPDFPKSGDTVRMYILIAMFGNKTSNLCRDCIVSGYYIDNGYKFPLFNDKPIGDNGIEFTYPGKRVIIVMERNGIRYKFYIPQPSLVQSFLTVVHENPLFILIFTVIGLLASVYSIYKILCSVIVKIYLRLRNL